MCFGLSTGEYLANWIQVLFNSLPPEDYKDVSLVLGGDGRYFNREAAQIIIKIAAGNGVGQIRVGRDGLMSTPVVSVVICKIKLNGGFIMSASHNPGGPDYDSGIKFNYSSGQHAPESITNEIYGNTLSVLAVSRQLASHPAATVIIFLEVSRVLGDWDDPVSCRDRVVPAFGSVFSILF